MSVLLRQTDGFEGLRAIQKINLPDDHASAKSHELKELLVDGDAASRSMPAHLDRDEHAVPKSKISLGSSRTSSKASSNCRQNLWNPSWP